MANSPTLDLSTLSDILKQGTATNPDYKALTAPPPLPKAAPMPARLSTAAEPMRAVGTSTMGGPVPAPASPMSALIGTSLAPSLQSPAAAPAVARPATTYVPGVTLPSAAQVASDKARAAAAQSASDAALGIGSPASINVSRQPNGVLSFSGTGGDGTGAVTYTGLPNWQSAQGGAGQGAVGSGFNLAEQNQRMAAALQGLRGMDRQNNVDTLIANTASGVGGPVGVAQNKIALSALGPLVERQMANDTQLGVTGIQAQTQRRGQDITEEGEQARLDASKYATDTQARTAAAQQAVDMQRAAAVMNASLATRSGANQKATQEARTQAFVNQLLSPYLQDGKTLKDPLSAARDRRDALAVLGRNPFGGMLPVQAEE